MAKKIASLLPANELRLQQFGGRLRLARLRRRLTAKRVSERAGMTAVTLRNLERGNSGVTIGAYLAVMQVLGLEQDLDLLGKDDPMGRELQDAALPRLSRRGVKDIRQGAPRAQPSGVISAEPDAMTSAQGTAGWVADNDFVSSDVFASETQINLSTPRSKDRVDD